LHSLIALVVANMIGIGVFTSSGFSLATLGNPGRVLLAWWLCGIWAIAGAIAYGGLVSRLPISGGEYLFLHRLVHPSVGFLAGWTSVFAGFTAPIALAAKGAAIHALPGATSSDFLVACLAAGLIVVAAGCHWAGVNLGTRTQNSIIAAKILLLLGVLLYAFAWTPAERWRGGALPGYSDEWLPENLSQWWVLAGSMSWIALSYTGFNAAVYVAGESRHAAKNVPLAMLLGTCFVTLLYLSLNYVFVYAPAPLSLVNENGFGREEVAVIAIQAIGGERMSLVVRMIIILAMVSSVFAMLMLGPRVYRQMALDGAMPKLLSDHRFRLAILIQCLLSMIAVFLGNILELMTYLGLTLSACATLTVGSLWWVHLRLPGCRPLRAWEHLSVALYVLISLGILAASAQQRPTQFQAMIVTFAAGLLVYFLWKLQSRRLVLDFQADPNPKLQEKPEKPLPKADLR
jgi:amino acid transporter